MPHERETRKEAFTREVYKKVSGLIENYLSDHTERKSKQIIRYVVENFKDASVNYRNILAILSRMEADGKVSVDRETHADRFSLFRGKLSSEEILLKRVIYFSKFHGIAYKTVDGITERLNDVFESSYNANDVEEAIVGLNKNDFVKAEVGKRGKEKAYRFRKTTTP